MELCIKNGRIHRADGGFYTGALYIRGDRITAPFDAPEVLDAQGALICPGMLDIHTHGRDGVDFCNASSEELAALAKSYARRGVTALLPTLASDTLPHWRRALEVIAACPARGVLGAHLEGRWLSPEKRGAHAAALLAPPCPEELWALADSGARIRKVTFAPELDRDGQFLKACLSLGACASIGHTNADFHTAKAALTAGATSFSHLFNAMPPLHHRAGGPVAAALTSDAYAELICDGEHVSPETVALVGKIKGCARTVLISDSMAGTGCPDGRYSIAGQPAYLKGGIARTADGALAGSTLELLRGVQNFAAFCGIPFGEALLSATQAPAESLGIGAEYGTLEEGALANLFFLKTEKDPQPLRVLAFGEWVN